MSKRLKALVSVAVFSLVLGGSASRPFNATTPVKAASNCTLSLKTFTGGSLTGWLGGVKTFTGSYLPFTTQLLAHVSPNNCVWRIDRSRADTSSWLTTKLASGKWQAARRWHLRRPGLHRPQRSAQQRTGP